ncbi:putative mitochondrial protein ymf17 [Apostasia shenzhenica]|uniref:Putative mitochondrial protein ymf17 n=1 Tax=Apostasia shenzhenica TaxID=1088818 RepID=A0A2I0AZ52_9ASPA|nr:putative mitochondrial protein ymf17 [Apostasia shenzhenica]
MMAARLFSSRSKDLALAITRALNPSTSPIDPAASSQCLRALHSRASSPLPPADRRSFGSGGIGAGSLLSGPLGPRKVFACGLHQALYGRLRALPLWSFAEAQSKGISHQANNSHLEQSAAAKTFAKGGIAVGATQADEKPVMPFSPLEGAAIGKRVSVLASESLKIKKFELSQKITFALIPALLLISSNGLTTSILIFSVYWQIYGFFWEIFLDYVHQEVTRKWVLIYFQLLLLILAKDTILSFDLV